MIQGDARNVIVLSFDYHDMTIGWPKSVMCTGIAGRGRKHGHKSNAQVATCTNKGDSRSPATALAEVIAGIGLAGGAEKANVGPVECAEVNVHEQERGRTTGRRRSPRPSRGYRWRQACWRD